ncbi:response regulator transcription factor [Winogradskyella arenosi]|uniref:DNA-binding response OmpR family regulator n=1 Tax=Winogradskyella arenosi TaxID=533325 RepID=A0A368ZJ28_9FLAO|nr:response regulator transcription factor [Winogradskyella arenosi]RCW92298.1 DNA-binding response OmpR family regulator [Winogradskyella arenosi]
MKILIVEDDPILNKNISEAISSEGYLVESIYDGILAERVLSKEDLSCVIMDINLPGKTGYELCKDFRVYNTQTPIIMLTAFSELEDKVKGYDCGADDYLTKPFFMRELILRVNSLIKRSTIEINKKEEASILSIAGITIDTTKKKVFRETEEINLTQREYQILLKLMKQKGEFVSKQELVTDIWGGSFDFNTNTIEVYISFLRNKLDKPYGKNTIKTKVGYGYYIDFN